MSDAEVKPKKEGAGKAFVVTLNKDAAEKVKAYLEQANSHLRGVTISKAQFVNWLINQSSAPLCELELGNLKAHFQSEKGRALWVYEEILRSEQAGLSKTIEEILKEKYEGQGQDKPVRQKRKKKDPSLLSNSLSDDIISESGVEKRGSGKENLPEPDLAPQRREI